MLIAVLELAFYGIFLATLVSFLRRRRPLERDVAAVFGSVALLLALGFLRPLLPGGATTTGDLAVALLAAQPFLTLRVVAHFRRLPIRAQRWPLLGLLLVVGLYCLGHGAAKPWDVLAVLPVVLYFIATEGLATFYLAREARRRAGVARARMGTAALASGLFGAAILLTAFRARGLLGDALSGLDQAVALAAALGYLFAFVPPRLARELGRRAVAYGFVRELNEESGGGAEQVWHRLADAAAAISGSESVLVLVDRADGSGPVRAAGVGSLPEAAEVSGREGTEVRVRCGPETGPGATVVCRLSGDPLFVDDDLALIENCGALALQVAARYRLADDLRRANQELARASAAKSEFLAAMSHELRTPLNAVIGFSELLLDPAEAGDAELTTEFAGHIRDAGMHLLDLINDVLDLSKVEAGRLELRPEELDLAQLSAETLQSMEPVAARKRVRLQVEAPASLPARVDPGRFRQIAYNLLSNAIKFTPEGGSVRLRIGVEAESISWAVSDTGPGIAPEDQERIFEAFVQGKLAAEQTEGTGLGLALTRRLVELHGGRLELRSEPGRGSEFTVRLPLTPPPVAPPAPAAGPAVEGRSGRRVLVIEDDDTASRLLEIYLHGAGYSVDRISSGEEGLARAASGGYLAILLDILLDGIDGWQVLNRLKADPATREIPVLVVSVVENRELGLALGAVDYLVKPINRGQLLQALARLESEHGRAAGKRLVLGIDDDPSALRLYQASLSAPDTEVVGAAGGAEGLRLARELRPDCILLDLLMPDLDGFEVLSRLRAEERTSRIPVIVVSAAEISEADRERLRGHVLAVVEKGDGALQGLSGWLSRASGEAPVLERV